jgi:sec-independent protein translocase protein TatA
MLSLQKSNFFMTHHLLFISGGEIIVIVFFVLLFFGADAIPGVARTIGKVMNEFHKATDDIKREIADQTTDIKSEITNLKDKVEKKSGEFNRQIDEELK